MLFFLGEFSGKYEDVCPRGTLRRVLARAEKLGYTVKAGFEFEFFVFEETPHSVREKNYRDLKPLQPGYFGYSVLRNTVESDLYRELLDGCLAMDMQLEGLHEETGPGVLEAAITVDDAIAAADKAALFKTFAKIMAQKHGLMATFMAKWSPDWPGQSGHIHISLAKKGTGKAAGKPVFYDAKNPDGMSKVMTQFVAGQQKLMPEFLSMIAPTVKQLYAPDSGVLGADGCDLGRRQPDHGAARHQGVGKVATGRIPGRGGGLQSVSGARRRHRFRSARHRGRIDAGAENRRQRL